MAASTFRAELRAGCKSVLDTFKAAHPTLLAHVYASRPGSFRTPCAFVDTQIAEPTITHDSGTRARELVARVYVVNKLVSEGQFADEQDALVDGLVDAFTAAPRGASASTLIEPINVDVDVVSNGDPPVSYGASVINVRGIERVGRL